MPAVIPAVAGAFIATAPAVVGVVGAFGATLLGGVAAGALSRALQPSQSSFDSTAAGALVNSSGPVDPIPVIYGSRRVGATRIFTEVTDGATFQQEYLHLVYAICEGEIAAINTVYLDDVASTDARFSGLVTIEKHLGTDTQDASAALQAAVSGWTAAHQGKGVAYVYLRLAWRQEAFPSGLPTVTFDVDGKLVTDLRTGGVTFSNNPALCIYDYLTNGRYGRGFAASLIEEWSFKDAANYCDTRVSVPGAGSPNPDSQKRYTCDGVLKPDDGWLENLRGLLSSCRGTLVFSGGQYKLRIDRDEATHLDLPGRSGNYASAQWSPSFDITTDIDLRAYVAADDWTPAVLGTIIAKWQTSNLAFRFGINITGALQLAWSADGNTALSAGSTAATGFADGSSHWVRVTMRVNAGGFRVILFQTSEDGDTWSLLGTAVIGASTSIFNSEAELSIGGANGGGINVLAGKIRRAQVYNGIDGILVADFDPASRTHPGSTSFEAATGETWTINQSANSAGIAEIASDGEVLGPHGFDEDNMVGAWTLRNAGKRDKFNRVRARFFNPERRWEADLAIYDDTAHRTEDNELVLEREIVLPFTSNYYRAMQLAQIEEKVSRFGLATNFRTTLAALKAEVMDVCPVTHSSPGWVAKPFRIRGLRPLANGEVEIQAREYQAAPYDLAALDTAPVIPATNLPDVFDVQPPSGIAFDQNDAVWDTVTLSWTASPTAFVSDYQVEYKLSTDSAYAIAGRVAGTSLAITRLLLFRQYDFRVKAINSVGVSSAYATLTASLDGSTVNPLGSTNGQGAVSRLSTISFSDQPWGMAWAPNTNLLFVATDNIFSGAVLVVNPVNDRHIATIQFGNRKFGSVIYCPHNGKVYARSQGSVGNERIFVIDPKTLLPAFAGSPADDGIPDTDSGDTGAECYAPNVQLLYFSTLDGVVAVDPDTDAVIASIAEDPVCGGLCYCPSNGRIYGIFGVDTITIINPVTNSIEGTIVVPAAISLQDIIYVPGGVGGVGLLYALDQSARLIHVINPSTNGVERTIGGAGSPTAFNSPVKLIYVPNSGLVYVSDPGFDRIVVVNPAAESILDNAIVSTNPRFLVAAPEVGKAYVSCGLGAGGGSPVVDVLTV
jgi:hypothetical protein